MSFRGAFSNLHRDRGVASIQRTVSSERGGIKYCNTKLASVVHWPGDHCLKPSPPSRSELQVQPDRSDVELQVGIQEGSDRSGMEVDKVLCEYARKGKHASSEAAAPRTSRRRFLPTRRPLDFRVT